MNRVDKKRICVGLIGSTDSFENVVANHVEYLYNSLYDQYVDVAISTIPGDNFHDVCAAMQPSFIDTMSESVPESHARILEYCQGEDYDMCILLRFDVLLNRPFIHLFNRGIHPEDGFYVVHRDMYTKAYKAFRRLNMSNTNGFL